MLDLLSNLMLLEVRIVFWGSGQVAGDDPCTTDNRAYRSILRGAIEAALNEMPHLMCAVRHSLIVYAGRNGSQINWPGAKVRYTLKTVKED